MIWAWAKEVYARPGVAAACLALQDLDGQNVPYLLWACYGPSPSEARLSQAAAIAVQWEAAATTPLRTVRRRLKDGVDGINPALSEELREGIKAMELQAERLLLEALAGPSDALTKMQVSEPESYLARLRGASLAYGRPAADKNLAALATALAGTTPPP